MKFLLLFCCALLLGACTTGSSNYRAATGDGPGYKEIALDSTSYRVQFKMRGNQRTAAQNHALHRAAELTLEAGYDWFIVSKQTRRLLNDERRNTAVDPLASPQTFSTRHCGLLGCKTKTYRPPEPDTGPEEIYTLVLLDIHMGRGIRPEKNSYNAQETLNRLSANK